MMTVRRFLLELVLSWSMMCINSRTTNGARPRNTYESVECVVSASLVSPYVRVYDRNSSTVSSRTHSLSCVNELHVIQLQEPSSAVSSSPATRLSLYIHSTNATKGKMVGGSMTFVLVSRNPVQWLFYPELLENHFYFQFWIAGGSHVYGRRVTEASVHKIPARRLETITNWVENNLGPITSYTRVPYANQNNITQFLEIGLESSIESPCPFMSQLVNGCLAILNQGINNRDVHVIELVDTDSSATRPSPVVELIVRPAIVRRQRSNLMLVLKSHCAAVWSIETRGLRGTLDIVTDDTLNITRIDMQSVRVITERLRGLGGQYLVDWTVDKYGPPVSYTYVPVADRLELIVDGQDYYSLPLSTNHTVPVDNGEKDDDEKFNESKSIKAVDKHKQGQYVVSQPHAVPTQEFTPCDKAIAYRPGNDIFLVIGISFAAFCIGCLLIGVLWYIHTHTVSKHKLKFRDDVKTEDVSASLTSGPLTSAV